MSWKTPLPVCCFRSLSCCGAKARRRRDHESDDSDRPSRVHLRRAPHDVAVLLLGEDDAGRPRRLLGGRSAAGCAASCGAVQRVWAPIRVEPGLAGVGPAVGPGRVLVDVGVDGARHGGGHLDHFGGRAGAPENGLHGCLRDELRGGSALVRRIRREGCGEGGGQERVRGGGAGGFTTGIHRTKVRTVSWTSIVLDENPTMLDLGFAT